MSERYRDYQHAIRVGGLLLGGLLVFLIVRASLVPADFGVYGFYRAGALHDNQVLPIQFGGQASCLDCHDGVEPVRKGSRHARIPCEACHGPLGRHASGESDLKPAALHPRLLCLSCHTKGAGKPTSLPQVIVADHFPDDKCADCHAPHRPKIE